MSEHANPAPQDTERLVAAIRETLAGIPEIHRKAVFKHATEAVWRDLIDQAEQAKAAARQAGPDSSAKAAAATGAYRS
jgi:NAD-dependent oxidoreductase involved in siderophore biosynthesis